MADPIVSGIYKIENLVNGKCYVGSASKIRNRWATHRTYLSQGRHHSAILQRSYNKHGKDAFVFSLLEVVENKEDLIAREQYWIDTLSPYYNVAKVAGSPIGVLRSQETRARISASNKGRKRTPEQLENIRIAQRAKAPLTGEAREKWIANLSGKKHSEETKKAMRIAHLGRKPTDEARVNMSVAQRKRVLVLSDEARQKMSESQRKRKHSPEHVAKVVAALTGRPVSEETREKIRQSALKRTHTAETKLKLSLAQKGKPKPKKTDETKRNMSNAQLLRRAKERQQQTAH